jgi:hypothetical protein
MGLFYDAQPTMVSNRLRNTEHFDGYSLDDRTAYTTVLKQAAATSFPAAYLDVASPWQLTSTLGINARVVVQRQLPWWSLAAEGAELAARYVNDRARAQLSLTWQALPTVAAAAGVDAFADAARQIPQDEPGGYLRDIVDTNFTGDGVTNLYNGALWGEAIIETPLFTLTTGARAEQHSVYGASFVPRVALTRVFGPAHAKLLVAGAFKAPGIANLELGPDIRPERSRVIEGEVGFEPFSATYLTANVFDIEINDPIVYFFDEVSGTENYVNARRTGTRGIELQALWSPSFGRFDLSWSFASADGKNDVGLYAVPGDPSRMLAQPAHKLAATAAFFLGESVTLTPSMVLRSERAAVTAVDDDGASVITDLPASAMVNVFLDAREVIPHLNVGVGVQNLFGEEFLLPQPYDSQHAALPAFDRTVFVRLGGTFGVP